MKRLLLLFIPLLLISCTSIPENAGSRILYLDGITVDETKMPTVCWYATEKYSDELIPSIKLQVGYFKEEEIGFILYGDGNEGILTS